jgi:hypothetical protein
MPQIFAKRHAAFAVLQPNSKVTNTFTGAKNKK